MPWKRHGPPGRSSARHPAPLPCLGLIRPRGLQTRAAPARRIRRWSRRTEDQGFPAAPCFSRAQPGSRGRGRWVRCSQGSFPERGCRSQIDRSTRCRGPVNWPGQVVHQLPYRAASCSAGSRSPSPVSAGEAEEPKRSQAAGAATRISVPFPVLRAAFAVGVRGEEEVARKVGGESLAAAGHVADGAANDRQAPVPSAGHLVRHSA
jgi:hypothetical protein